MKITPYVLTLLFSTVALAQKTVEVKCDSIYKNKGIVIRLETFNDKDENDFGKNNSVLVIEKNDENRKLVLLKDSIFSAAQKIEFADFNNDKIKDILVQNSSDVRSNWTYYLYLYDSKNNSFKKVEGFEEIKVPKFNAKYNLVENYVMSGRNWTSFYRIKNTKIQDLGIVIYDGENEKGINTYEKDYQAAIKKITSRK